MSFHVYDLTEAQARYLDLYCNDYVNRVRISVHRLEGDLDIERLAAAVESLQQCTSIFNRSFSRSGSRWFMLVGAAPPPSLQIVDLRGRDDAVVAELIRELANTGFRPEHPPLARFSLIISPKDTYFVFTAAPWLIDQYSLPELYSAVSSAYNRQDFASQSIDLDQDLLLTRDANFRQSDRHREARRFWHALVGERRTEIEVARWPNSEVTRAFLTQYTPSTEQNVLAVSQQLQITNTLLRTFLLHLVLARFNGSESIVTNTISPFRHDATRLSSTGIGHTSIPSFVVSTPCRDLRLMDYLLNSIRLYQQCQLHQQFSSFEILDQQRQYEPELHRLSNVTIVTDFFPSNALALEGVSATLLPEFTPPSPIADFSLVVSARSHLEGYLQARNPAHVAALKQWQSAYFWFQQNLIDNLDRSIADIDWLSDETRRSLFSLAISPPRQQTPKLFLQRFLDQVERNPDVEALRCGHDSLTYRQLLTAADAVAAHLSLPSQDETLVGICLNRGVGMIVSLLGVMRAGAGYVPLDPSNPPERLTYILNDSKAHAVICDAETSPRLDGLASTNLVHLPSLERLLNGEMPAFNAELPPSTSIAYVIYTSGTTGMPKGVVVEQGNLATFLAATDEVCNCGPGQRWMQFASINFDASVLEIASALARGAALVVADSVTRTDPHAVLQLLENERITHAFLPPALLRSLPRSIPSCLTDIYMGGEAGDQLTSSFWSRGVRLWNVYGPTETTVMCSVLLIDAEHSVMNLGGPMPGYIMIVLDESMRLVPHGAVGELWIGGDAVTRGYLNRELLTAERFVPNPFGHGRLYRSGDLVRHLPNGDLEYLGRNDFQVKIRGFRIELGDIESAISAVSGVTGVFVTVVEDHAAKSIAAWYTGGPQASVVSQLIGERLPYYMVPTFLQQLECFPLNISGKIDRSRLFLPEANATAVAGLTPLEAQVRLIWAELLGVDASSISVASNFFHLGGHSLLAAATCHRVNEVIGCSIRPRLLFESPTLGQFCSCLRSQSNDASTYLPLEPTGAIRSVLPGAMPSILLNRQLQYGSDTAYTICMRVDLCCEVNPLALRKAFINLVNSDPIFRTSLVENSGQSVLEVASDVELLVPIHIDESIDALAQQFRMIAFDLSKPPLWRAAIVVEAESVSILFSIHHAIFDGWSLNLLLQQLAAEYDAVVLQQSHVRHAATMLDYGSWLSNHADLLNRDTSYWQNKLSGVDCRTVLPTATGVSRPQSNRDIAFDLPAQVTQQLKDIASETGTTLSPVLFSLYLIWIWRITGQSNLVVAYPFAGRDIPGTEQVFGMLVQMGFLHIQLDPEETFADLLMRVSKQMVMDREHFLASPYDADLSLCGAPNLIFSLQTGIDLNAHYGSLTFQAYEYSSPSSKADLSAIFYDRSDGSLAGRIEVDSSALDLMAIDNLMPCLRVLAESVSAQQRVAQIAYLAPEALQQIKQFAAGPELVTPQETLVQALRSSALAYANHLAIDAHDQTLTYAEFDKLTDQLAAAICQMISPRRRLRIGLSVTKSAELIVAAVAILKAGCAYVPLDSAYPLDRLQYIVDDAEVEFVVADQACAEVLRRIDAHGLIFLDPHDNFASVEEGPLPLSDVRDLAYIIYTSGSTGRPKGVMVEHATVTRLIRGLVETIGFTDSARLLLLGTLNFDPSVAQIFTPLLNGATLVVPSSEIDKDFNALHALIDDKAVTHLFTTPALVRNLPRQALPKLQFIAYGGEALDSVTAEYWMNHVELWCLYGPTETTVMCSAGRLNTIADCQTIGRPLPGYRLMLRNALLDCVPLGAVGEIYITGGSARGYLGRPDLTMERFIADPDGDQPFDLAYRSGDLGRYLPDGSIQFLGRNDDQIKLRGFRIELGEIESVLLQFPEIQQAIAMVRGEGDARRLVAYVTGPASLDLEACRLHCHQLLPEFMVPSLIVRIDVMPLTSNGKLDRSALPDVTFTSASAPPRDGLEMSIAQIWEHLLNLQGIGRDDDFFRLGGNSLLASRLRALLKERLNLDLSTSALYAAPTIAALASRCDDHPLDTAMMSALKGVVFNGSLAPRQTLPAQPVVLLTGAAGFLGVFLLAQLQSQGCNVICLLRGADLDTALFHLQRQAEAASVTIDMTRLDVVLSDLSLPSLGLEHATWNRLSDQVDLILHCGAWVHHRYSFTTLRASNVDSTEQLIQLALSGAKRSRFCFVSTEAVARSLANQPSALEAVSNASSHPPQDDNGYVLSKWVGEQLVCQASQSLGLDALIARPGNITGDTATAYSNYRSNHFWLFVKACLQLQAVPQLPNDLEMMPVDTLSSAIVALSLQDREGLMVANLGNTVQISWPDLLTVISTELSLPITVVEPQHWQSLLAAAPETNALFPLRDLYQGDLMVIEPPVERHRSRSELARLGLSYDADPHSLARFYARYLQQQGFWTT